MTNNPIKPSLLMRLLPLSVIEGNYIRSGLAWSFSIRIEMQEYIGQCERETRKWEREYQRRGFQPITIETFSQSFWGKTIDPKYLRIPVLK